MTREYLSCDWGTSSFRLRWVHADDLRVIRECRDQAGCKSIFDQSIAAGSNAEARAELYAKFLWRALEPWAQNAANSGPIPLVISGMASSTIGWKELAYASAPLHLDASNLRFEKLEWEKPKWVRATYLISGLATGEEIMRGEETEALGLLADSAVESSLLILPGTHSKHLRIDKCRIVDFSTHMTGELFDVLARNSILKASVNLAALAAASPENLEAFDSGVRRAQSSGLSASLFQTRTRAVLHKCGADENAWFLSGVLIGGELCDLARADTGFKVLLGGTLPLRSLYARALRAMHITAAWEELPEERVEKAVPAAHRLFLQQQHAWEA